MIEMHCPACGKYYADRDGTRLIVKRASMVINGGIVAPTCARCGHTTKIDLRSQLTASTSRV